MIECFFYVCLSSTAYSQKSGVTIPIAPAITAGILIVIMSSIECS